MTSEAAIIVTSGVQDEEYIYPYYRLQEAGFVLGTTLHIATISGDSTIGKYGIPVRATTSIKKLLYEAAKLDLLIIPGGWETPEKLRMDESTLQLIRALHERKKIIAAICHGPQVLISSGILKGVRATAYIGIKDDMINSGCNYMLDPLVVDNNIVTAQHYRNNPEFVKAALDAYDSMKFATKSEICN